MVQIIFRSWFAVSLCLGVCTGGVWAPIQYASAVQSCLEEARSQQTDAAAEDCQAPVSSDAGMANLQPCCEWDRALKSAPPQTSLHRLTRSRTPARGIGTSTSLWLVADTSSMLFVMATEGLFTEHAAHGPPLLII